MAGNVWQWVQDCSHDNYNGAPTDGSAWTIGSGLLTVVSRVVRGGSYGYGGPETVRPASRWMFNAGYRALVLRFPAREDAHPLNFTSLASWVQGEALVDFFWGAGLQ